MDTFAIVNPGAGGGRAVTRWPQIQNLLTDAIGPFEHSFTNGPQDATKLARHAINQGVRRIIAVGGDGTINETVNGFADGSGGITNTCALGVVPCGTGSDFCRSFGINSDPAAAIARIASGQERRIDLGRAVYQSHQGGPEIRYFLNIASFGLSGAIAGNINRSAGPSWLPGQARYLIETLRSLVAYRSTVMKLTVDGVPMERDVMIAAVANGQYFGGGMQIAPGADPQDGQLDVVVISSVSKARLVRKILQVYRGAHLDLPEVEVFRGSRIIVEADAGPVLLELDGESPGHLTVEFTIVPQAVRVLL